MKFSELYPLYVKCVFTISAYVCYDVSKTVGLFKLRKNLLIVCTIHILIDRHLESRPLSNDYDLCRITDRGIEG